MKNLVIIGAGAFARETHWHATYAQGYGEEFTIKGFIEGNIPLKPAKEYAHLQAPLLGNVLTYEPQPDDVFVIAITNGDAKEAIAKIMDEKNVEYMNIIPRLSIVEPTAKLGKGLIMGSFCAIDANAQIGDHVMLCGYSDIGHDCVVGDYTSIMGHVELTGHTEVGSHTLFGGGSRTIPGIKIGSHATIGAGSIVLKDVAAGSTVFGNPARSFMKKEVKK